MSKRRKSKLPLWAKITLGILGVGAAFCVAVLIYGGCVGQTFGEVVKDWFTPDKVEETKDTVTEAARIMFNK